jgi:hypothetical protein
LRSFFATLFELKKINKSMSKTSICIGKARNITHFL